MTYNFAHFKDDIRRYTDYFFHECDENPVSGRAMMNSLVNGILEKVMYNNSMYYVQYSTVFWDRVWTERAFSLQPTSPFQEKKAAIVRVKDDTLIRASTAQLIGRGSGAGRGST